MIIDAVPTSISQSSSTQGIPSPFKEPPANKAPRKKSSPVERLGCPNKEKCKNGHYTRKDDILGHLNQRYGKQG